MKEISGVNGKIIIYLSILIYVLYVDMTPDPYSHQGVILLAHFNNDCRMINNIYFKLAPVIVNPILETVTGTEGSTHKNLAVQRYSATEDLLQARWEGELQKPVLRNLH